MTRLARKRRHALTTRAARRPRHALTTRAARALLGALSLGAAFGLTPAQGQVQETISNGLTTMVFEVDGTDLWIQSVTNDELMRVVSPLEGSGGFRLRLIASSEPSPGAGPLVNDTARWFELGPDGLIGWNTAVWASAPAVVTANAVVHDVNGGLTLLDAVWSGTIDWSAAEPGAPLMKYEVVVRWATEPGEALPQASLRIELTPADGSDVSQARAPAGGVRAGADAQRGDGRGDGRGAGDVDPGGPTPLLYASTVVHPIVRVPSFDDPGETLLIPNLGGSLVVDPTNQPFPTRFGRSPNAFPINMAAYAGCEGAPDCDDPTAFVTWDDDFGGGWKTLLFAKGTDPLGTGYIEFGWEHVPEDIFTNGMWTAPWDIRIGVSVGDWWETSRLHREALAASGVPWYGGPVSSPDNPRPDAAKDLAAEVFLVPGHLGDNMDLISRMMMDMTRVLGPHVNVVMYGAHAPDAFDEFLGNGGYLEPGRPTFAGAVREGQAQFGHVVSPYINGSSIVDYVEAGIPPTPDLQGAYDARLLDEDLAAGHTNSPITAFMCPGHKWWAEWLPQNVTEILRFSGAHGVYLDYFLTGVCYASDHGSGLDGVGHAPGGGDYMLRGRSEQLAAMRDQLGDDVLLSIEFLMGRWADQVDVMHTDIERSFMPTGSWLCCSGGSCTSYGNAGACFTACGLPCIEETHPTARTVPLFRTVHDDVRLSRITSGPVVARADRLAWIEATHVFAFGQVPQVTRSEFEFWPLFGARFSFAPYYGYFQPGSGSDTTTVLPFGDNDPNDSLLVPSAKPMDVASYQRFASRLASAVQGYDQDTLFGLPPSTVDGFVEDLGHVGTQDLLQGPDGGPFLEGLRPWHNGGLRRRPEHWAVETSGSGVVGDVRTIPSVEPVFDDGVWTTSPVYTELGWLDTGALPVGDPAFVASFIPTGMFQAPFDLKGSPPVSLPPASAQPGLLGGGVSGNPGVSTETDGPLLGDLAPEPVSTLGGSLAYVMTNPWIDRELPGTFEVGFRFEPDRYPGWSDVLPYRVTRFSVTGEVEVVSSTHVGDLVVSGHELEPGDIHWWVFRPATPIGD